MPRLGTPEYSNLAVKRKEYYEDGLLRTYFAKTVDTYHVRICSSGVYIILEERNAAHCQRTQILLVVPMYSRHFHSAEGFLTAKATARYGVNTVRRVDMIEGRLSFEWELIFVARGTLLEREMFNFYSGRRDAEMHIRGTSNSGHP